MKRTIVLGIILGAGVLSIAAAAAQAPAQAPRVIEMQKLRDNFYVLLSSTPGNNDTFSGGNVSVFVTDGGVTLVDTKLAGWGQAMLDKIKSVTDKPVTTVINTHTHADHTGNNNLFTSHVSFIAHENTKANMEKMPQFKDANAKFLPAVTYATEMKVGSGKDEIDLRYFGPGHTNGDTWVYFPALKVLATGDMFAWKDAPLCDRSNGGSCAQFSQTLARALKVFSARNVADVIPGHSPIMKIADLEQYRNFTQQMAVEAMGLKKAGKSVDEAAMAIATGVMGKFRGYKTDRLKAAVQVVYDETK